ncbi:MAG: phosphoglucosamine mutase [Clostridia bacterium]|nr:phosphoglucosamine mutase [Clostridia bacterium]
MGKYFGTDGFRGEANKNLTAEHAFKIGRFIGSYISSGDKKTRVVIGKDTRRSSYMLEYALAAGLTASGADAYLMHVTTTPSVAYVVRTEGFDCGVMISASHNPYYDNGIKLISPEGEKMGDEFTDKIEEYLDNKIPDPPYAEKEKIGIDVDFAAGRNRYIGYLISLATRSYRGKRICLDCANGSAWMIARSVFNALGATTYVISDNPDGTNINLDCGSTHIDRLVKFVKDNNLDAGFAFDGDSDRCIAVDEKGNVVNGDHILYICGKYLKARGKLNGNKIVTTVMSNFGLYKALDSCGIEYEKTQVGDRFVYECMKENDYRLGGEQSGHIIFSSYATTGDGILTSIMLMEVMLETKLPLSELHEGLKIYPQELINISHPNKDAALNDPYAKAVIEGIAAELGNNGRILVRKSGTEPLIRVMVEAQNGEQCKRLCKMAADALLAVK